jgi:hypothetical protein
VEFDRHALLERITEIDGLREGLVDYRTLSDAREFVPTVEELPFLKRWGFEHESEVRLIYASESERIESLDIEIALSCINKLTFSPWIHPDVFESVRATLKELPSCKRIRMFRSTLIGNEEWKEIGDSAVAPQEPRPRHKLARDLVLRKR